VVAAKVEGFLLDPGIPQDARFGKPQLEQAKQLRLAEMADEGDWQLEHGADGREQVTSPHVYHEGI
jgi:hypothetical protein